jgi:hypothetical protein
MPSAQVSPWWRPLPPLFSQSCTVLLRHQLLHLSCITRLLHVWLP